jgi:thiol-disulfide isomerase/thioredoxin
MKRIIPLLLAAALHAGTAHALELGDTAPEIVVNSWAKGETVTLEAARGKEIVVVEFWATWCGPCRVSIPHLTKVQQQFKDKGVRIVGLTDEAEDVVKPFVDDMGAQMEYSVGIDTSEQTQKAYMAPFKVNGIPHAFVVDKDGRIVWHGHPADNLESVLKDVIDGKHDLEKAKRQAKASELLSTFSNMNRFGGSDKEKLDSMGEEIMKLAEGNAPLLGKFAYTIVNSRSKSGRNMDQAMRAAKIAYEIPDGKTNAIVIDAYATVLLESGKKTEALEILRTGIKETKDVQHRPYLERRLTMIEKSNEPKAAETTATSI